MKVTLEPTTQIVILDIEGAQVPSRLWQGETDTGTPVHAFIVRIGPEITQDHPDYDKTQTEFERSLQPCARPRVQIYEIPLRLIL